MSSVASTPPFTDVRGCCKATVALDARTALPRKPARALEVRLDARLGRRVDAPGRAVHVRGLLALRAVEWVLGSRHDHSTTMAPLMSS
jgi:hypothetical protein